MVVTSVSSPASSLFRNSTLHSWLFLPSKVASWLKLKCVSDLLRECYDWSSGCQSSQPKEHLKTLPNVL